MAGYQYNYGVLPYASNVFIPTVIGMLRRELGITDLGRSAVLGQWLESVLD